MPLGAYKLNSIARYSPPAVSGLQYVVQDTGLTDDGGWGYTDLAYCGDDSSGRPVFVFGYSSGTAVPYTSNVVMMRVEDDLSCTFGTANTISSTSTITYVTSEYMGAGYRTNTGQQDYGYVAYNKSGSSLVFVRAFSFNKNALTTTLGNEYETVSTVISQSYVHYINTRRVLVGGRGGGNGRYMVWEVFDRTSNSTTLTRVGDLPDCRPEYASSRAMTIPVGSNNWFTGMGFGNNGIGVDIGINRYNGGNTRVTNGGDLGISTQFNSALNYYVRVDTNCFAWVGFGNISGYNNLTDGSMITVTWNTGSTVPTFVESNVGVYIPNRYGDFTLVPGEEDGKFYFVWWDSFNSYKMKFREVRKNGTSFEKDAYDAEVPNYTNNLNYDSVYAITNTVTHGSDYYSVIIARATSNSKLWVTVLKNLKDFTNTTTARTAKTVTGNGNVTLSTAQKRMNNYSCLFDGTGDYLNCGNSSDFHANQDGWTFDCHIRPVDVTGSKTIASKRNGSTGWLLSLENGYLEFKLIGYPSTGVVTGSTIMAINTWYHVAIVKNGDTYTLYRNGVNNGSITTSDTVLTNTNPMLIGRDSQNTSNDWNGYIDELRVSKVARFTANFTVRTFEWISDEDTTLLLHFGAVNSNLTTFTDDNGQVFYSPR